MTEQLKEVDLGIIRYANVWEDADVLMKGLHPNEDSVIVSIASAGDNCFALLKANPRRVIAVDVSLVQLFLIRLKAIAIEHLSHEDFLVFIGVTKGNRLEIYNRLTPYLDLDTKNYWDKNQAAIEEGIMHIGKFERYFQLFKKSYLHKVHSQEVVNELLKKKSIEDQKDFHDSVWHTEEWIKLYKFFFGEQMLGDKGRDPEFLKHIKGSTSDLILEQEVNHFRSSHIFDNYFLNYILNNEWSNESLPFYLRKENYDIIRKNIHKLEFVHGLIEDSEVEPGTVTHFNLSDIFEYMDEQTFQKVVAGLGKMAAKNAVFAYWNLMVERDMESVNSSFRTNKTLSNQLKEIDKGYFYKQFNITVYGAE